jgi:hypothetical protein
MKRDELLIATAALMGFEFPIETSVALPHVVGVGGVSAPISSRNLSKSARSSSGFPAFPLVVSGSTL